MRYLASALISEGVSDDRFLPFLLYRALEEICLTRFEDPVDVDQVTVLRHLQRPPNVPEILGLVEENADTFHLVFVHRDRGANADRVRDEWIAPLIKAWGRSRSERLVPVVPVRETEAWLLADGAALRAALGVQWSDAEMGVPARPKDVEAIADPKIPIGRLARRRGRPIEDFFEEIAESISLDVLRKVPSFDAFEQQTVEALADMGYRRGVT
ncbi:DUF4276 family protein [Paractinoplanes atraurantiacus]|uniref:DUF4276 family protein n=1 Tax=Paractinoplanes atraurantiacus TaxID=1036182 RepID=A0A285FLV5_9ACTN|nr:DUF4276 family protein [Actinoplanes atraurantiacus]SNY12270.1 protein of unknown function [Actinoplanes atraurantiacus]